MIPEFTNAIAARLGAGAGDGLLDALRRNTPNLAAPMSHAEARHRVRAAATREVVIETFDHWWVKLLVFVVAGAAGFVVVKSAFRK